MIFHHIASLAMRGLISQYSGMSLQKALVHNGIDAAISYLATMKFFKSAVVGPDWSPAVKSLTPKFGKDPCEFFNKYNPFPPSILASRVVGMITATLITNFLFERINPLLVIALNVGSLAMGVFFFGAEIHSNQSENPMDLFTHF